MYLSSSRIHKLWSRVLEYRGTTKETGFDKREGLVLFSANHLHRNVRVRIPLALYILLRNINVAELYVIAT